VSDPFEAAGAMLAPYRDVDWAATPLGLVESWSPALRAAVNLMVRSEIGAALLWGPDFVLLYNEAYTPILAEKHPSALGRPARDVFPEVWPDIQPLLTSVFSGNGTVFIENLRLLINRHNMLQESYFTFSYSAVAADDGTLEGVLDVVAETTAQVVGHRRLALLSRLISRLADLDPDGPQDLLDRALPVLRAATDDFAEVHIALSGMPAPAALTGDGRGDGRTLSVRLAADTPAHDGSLVVRLNEHLLVDAAVQEFVALIGTALERSLSRLYARHNERRSATLEREMSEALQHSLLTEPVQFDQLQVAVRYRPAAEQAQVGGDWYDAFRLPDGSLTVVVGDVTGHDSQSAAAMAQVRNITRGVAYTLQKPPSRVLSGLDAAMSGLDIKTCATVILAQIDQIDTEAEPGSRIVRWSSAGHPPPVLLHSDGTVQVLDTRADMLLGTRWAVTRSDHTAVLRPGSSVVFYTDGLVERRRTGIDEGIAELVNLLTGQREQDAEQICDLLLAHLGYTTEDDIVLAVIHAYP
jgi:serine phosphatase RsbU (regulator of sigma subunit)